MNGQHALLLELLSSGVLLLISAWQRIFSMYFATAITPRRGICNNSSSFYDSIFVQARQWTILNCLRTYEGNASR